MFVPVQVVGCLGEVTLHLHIVWHHRDVHRGAQTLLQLLQHARGHVPSGLPWVLLDRGVHIWRRVGDFSLQVHDQLVDAALIQRAGHVTVAGHHMRAGCLRQQGQEVIGL